MLYGHKASTTHMNILLQEQNQLEQGATHRDKGKKMVQKVKMEWGIIEIVEVETVTQKSLDRVVTLEGYVNMYITNANLEAMICQANLVPSSYLHSMSRPTLNQDNVAWWSPKQVSRSSARFGKVWSPAVNVTDEHTLDLKPLQLWDS